MPEFVVLQRGWKSHLANLISNARTELLIASPYVTEQGTEFVAENLHASFRGTGHLTFLTDLSPLNVAQGATNPHALRKLEAVISTFSVRHLPRLHAKVYVADGKRAIVTSGNLTAGGLALNYEYGVELANAPLVRTVRQDIIDYASLGADVSADELQSYCQAADRVRLAFRKEREGIAKSIKTEFAKLLRTAEDKLIKLRLAEGPIHTVFAKTILYLLSKHGALSTQHIHQLIREMHPDLCDDTVDRVIDGKRYGKKWKHAVRTAQQHLKGRGLVRLIGDQWSLK